MLSLPRLPGCRAPASGARRPSTPRSLSTDEPLTVRNQAVDRSVAVNDSNVNDSNKINSNGAQPYLHVMPREPAGGRWHVFQLSDESPRITFAESVSSYAEAHKLATRQRRPLRFARQAWQQMVAAGVAPQTVPEDTTLV